MQLRLCVSVWDYVFQFCWVLKTSKLIELFLTIFFLSTQQVWAQSLLPPFHFLGQFMILVGYKNEIFLSVIFQVIFSKICFQKCFFDICLFFIHYFVAQYVFASQMFNAPLRLRVHSFFQLSKLKNFKN